MRNVEDLILETLVIKLYQTTGIPTGRILAKMPDYEFVNKLDGTNQTTTNEPKFPSIGMRYYDKVRYGSNTYGSAHLIDNNDGTGIEYQPMGEMSFPLSIYLFTNSRAEQMNLGNKILMEFAQNPFYSLEGDELDNEYVQVNFSGFTDLPSHRPYIKVFDILCSSRVFTEVSGYLVDNYIVSMSADSGRDVDSIETDLNGELFSYGPTIPPDELDPDVDTYFQDWNIVYIDLDDDGDYERIVEP